MMNVRLYFFLTIFITPLFGHGQSYTASRIFAHNDYVRDKPFHTSYDTGVGYIEADVFLQGDDLMVAHHKNEIEQSRTLTRLYLEPMAEKVKKNKGLAYPDRKKKLTIMIDLKTEGIATLKALVAQLEKFPSLTACPTLQFMISGNVPRPDTWNEYPDYIYFDGRPGIPYTRSQLKRVSMISTGFRQHSQWDGRTPLSPGDRKKMRDLVDEAHSKGKPFRFWATPDFPEAWTTLMEMNMDVIVTDDVQGLAAFIRSRN